MRPSARRPAPRPARPLPAAVEVRIDRIGAEGDGVAALPDGTPLYLPFTLPGETVLARPLAPLGRGWVARAEAPHAPSPERVPPACPHAGTCGGCSLQHWAAPGYRAWKSGLLAAALERSGFAIAPAPLVTTPPGERRRMDLALLRAGAGVRVGLHATRSQEVVDLAACRVLAPDLFALLAPLRTSLAGRALLRRQGSAVANLTASGIDLLLRTDAPLSQDDRAALVSFAGAQHLARLSWARNGEAPETLCAFRPPQMDFSGIAVRPPAGAFLQASAAGEAAIVAAVCAGLPKLTAKSRIVELFAGCGTLTFALARHARVAAYEGDAAACAALHAAACAASLDGRIRAEQRDLARRPLVPTELAGTAAVVLDPPHTGAAAQMPALAAARPGRIIYVSCNPATLARDAAMLRAAGYTAAATTPIDQFLWSARLESVTIFRV